MAADQTNSDGGDARLGILLAIPAYRESARLPRFLESLASAVESGGFGAKVLVVDDGSGPREQELLMQAIGGLREVHACILPPLLLKSNIGKGGAILAAWRSCLGASYFGFVDADGAVSAEEVSRVAAMLETGGGGPALFGCRVKMLGKRVSRSWSRHVIGRIFATFVGALIDSGVYDSQCGLKFIPAPAFKKLDPYLKGYRFAFDVELLAGLNKIHCQVKEVPIDWQDIPGSKVSFIRDVCQMFAAIFHIRKDFRSLTP
jgi:dolichyl-phosphate beta-glucosyltransferase